MISLVLDSLRSKIVTHRIDLISMGDTCHRLISKEK